VEERVKKRVRYKGNSFRKGTHIHLIASFLGNGLLCRGNTKVLHCSISRHGGRFDDGSWKLVCTHVSFVSLFDVNIEIVFKIFKFKSPPVKEVVR
jgi:predicted ATPase